MSKDVRKRIEELKAELNNLEKSLPEKDESHQTQPLQTVLSSQPIKPENKLGFTPLLRKVIIGLAIICFYFQILREFKLPLSIDPLLAFQLLLDRYHFSSAAFVNSIAGASPVVVIPLIAGVISTLRKKGFAAYYYPTQLFFIVAILLILFPTK